MSFQMDEATLKKFILTKFFGYIPDINLCYISIGVLGLLTIILTIQNIMTKKYWYMYVLSFSGVAEILGYVGRIVTINDPNLTNFIFMDVFLLLTPNLLAYVEYKTVSLLMKKINMSKAWGVLPAKWVSALFVTSDVVSFVVQSCAAGYLTSGNEDLIKTGKIIMLTGYFKEVYLDKVLWIYPRYQPMLYFYWSIGFIDYYLDYSEYYD